LNVIEPWVTAYAGCPKIAWDNVDFPDPFGPIIACTSPLAIERLMPFKISFDSTETCRSLISNISFIVGYLIALNTQDCTIYFGRSQ